ncbi:uncharacterized protein LOC133779213 [Humulus lupulus]|uniref:uncharacterized protein LOC133779213 n=1 Tax=Humulus lupulus TaxID=3486 RepID=UPI002B4093E8|nr:uncharacterized protein LOC133779213 [Humulus lupulus]
MTVLFVGAVPTVTTSLIVPAKVIPSQVKPYRVCMQGSKSHTDNFIHSRVVLKRIFMEEPLTINVLAMIMLAIWASITKGSLCGNLTWAASSSVNVMGLHSYRGVWGVCSSTANTSSPGSCRSFILNKLASMYIFNFLCLFSIISFLVLPLELLTIKLQVILGYIVSEKLLITLYLIKVHEGILTLVYDNSLGILYSPSYHIEETHWKEFVKRRTSKEFQDFRKLQQEMCNHLQYPHRTSRHSYTELEADLQAKWDTTEEIDRSILWKEAIKDSSGNYVTERDNVMGEAIISCKMLNDFW